MTWVNFFTVEINTAIAKSSHCVQTPMGTKHEFKEYTKLVDNQFSIVFCSGKDVLINLSAASNMFIFYIKGNRYENEILSWM